LVATRKTAAELHIFLIFFSQCYPSLVATRKNAAGLHIFLFFFTVLPFGCNAQNRGGVYALSNHVLAHLQAFAGKKIMTKNCLKVFFKKKCKHK